jgi:hypothetical protein
MPWRDLASEAGLRTVPSSCSIERGARSMVVLHARAAANVGLVAASFRSSGKIALSGRHSCPWRSLSCNDAKPSMTIGSTFTAAVTSAAGRCGAAVLPRTRIASDRPNPRQVSQLNEAYSMLRPPGHHERASASNCFFSKRRPFRFPPRAAVGGR